MFRILSLLAVCLCLASARPAAAGQPHALAQFGFNAAAPCAPHQALARFGFSAAPCGQGHALAQFGYSADPCGGAAAAFGARAQFGFFGLGLRDLAFGLRERDNFFNRNLRRRR